MRTGKKPSLGEIAWAGGWADIEKIIYNGFKQKFKIVQRLNGNKNLLLQVFEIRTVASDEHCLLKY